jgi:hypothetical protein
MARFILRKARSAPFLIGINTDVARRKICESCSHKYKIYNTILITKVAAVTNNGIY